VQKSNWNKIACLWIKNNSFYPIQKKYLIYDEIHQEDVAIKYLMHAINHNKTIIEYYVYLAYIYINKSNKKKSKYYLSALKNINKNSPHCTYELIHAFYLFKIENKINDAKKMVLSALNDCVSNYNSKIHYISILSVHFQYFICGHIFGGDDMMQALQYYNKALEYRQYFSIIYYKKSQLLYKMKKYHDASRNLNTSYHINQQICTKPIYDTLTVYINKHIGMFGLANIFQEDGNVFMDFVIYF